jgi:hypothetical protein
MAYFYFDFNDREKQCHENLIRSLITQFSTQCTSCPDALTRLYSQCHDGKQQPAVTALLATLRHIIGGFRHAYIILDALDECTEREDLLAMIGEMVDWKLDNLHLLMTSRKERDIEDCLESQVSCQINIQQGVVDADIHIHICERLQNDTKLKKWPMKVQEEIETVLMEVHMECKACSVCFVGN